MMMRVLPERMRSSMISASPRKAAACSGVRFSASCRTTRDRLGDKCPLRQTLVLLHSDVGYKEIMSHLL